MAIGPGSIFGSKEGTGATINVSIGFIPEKVILKNIDDTSDFPELEWVTGMDAGFGTKRVGSTFSRLTTLGVSEYAGSPASASAGFTIGADTDINVDGETILWEAVRGIDA